MEILKTASGKTFDCDMFSVIQSPPRCYIRLPGESFASALQVFSDPAETIQIWYGTEYVSGFSGLQAISDSNGAVMVTLKKE